MSSILAASRDSLQRRSPALDSVARTTDDLSGNQHVLEWWSAHGSFYAATAVAVHFSVTLFHSRRLKGDVQRDGFQLLVSTMIPGRVQPHRFTTCINEALLDDALETLAAASLPIDPFVQRALLRELIDHGPPLPIQVNRAPIQFTDRPFELLWDDFRFSLDEDGYCLQFPDPERKECYLLHVALESLNQAADHRTGEIHPAAKFQRWSAGPLSGRTASGAAIAGVGSLSHGTAPVGLLDNPLNPHVPAWDQCEIELDDGTSFSVLRHRDARTGAPLAVQFEFGEGSPPINGLDDVALTPLRHWESPSTRARYPVAWEIDVPKINASFTFEPLVEDQEIPLFDLSRSMWDGVGSVTGVIEGRQVQGQARVRLHGYGYIFNHNDLIAQLARRVDGRLEELLPRQFTGKDVERLVGPAIWQHDVEAYNRTLATPVWDLIDRSGKRWRPIFGLLLLDALGQPSEPYEAFISLAELLHAGALIVDDIEDNSLLRRGQECLHLRYGLDVALNAGNTLYFLPSVSLMQHPLLTEAQRGRIFAIKDRLCIEAHCGQASDIHWSRGLNAEELERRLAGSFEDKLLQMYAYKTAAASAALAEIVAVIADAPAETMAACQDFGRLIGVAYQIIDDIHNFSRSPDWTKVTGEDLATGKLTYVICKAIRRLPGPDSARLKAILCSAELRGDRQTLDEGVDLVLASGALEECRHEAAKLARQGWDRLTAHLPPSEPKILLHVLCMKLLDLAYDG